MHFNECSVNFMYSNFWFLSSKPNANATRKQKIKEKGIKQFNEELRIPHLTKLF